MQKEQKLYPIVEKWMKREFCCFKTAKNTGLQDSRIDVVGVTDKGGEMSGDEKLSPLKSREVLNPLQLRVDKHWVIGFMPTESTSQT